MVLEDKEEGRYVNLRKATYSYTPKVLGIEHDRFVLHLTRSSRVATTLLEDRSDMENDIRFSSGFNRLNVEMDASFMAGPGPEARIEVFDRTGRKLKSRNATNGQNQIELAGGQIYIVRVNVGNQSVTKKVAVR